MEIDVFGEPVLKKTTQPEEIVTVDMPRVTILVLSCDKNRDIFEAFHHCMEKYWPNHPEIIYKTETIVNPYYKTLCKNYPLEQWTRGIREALQEISTEQVLIMIDDCFIRCPVDQQRIKYISDHLQGNVACVNLEHSFDPADQATDLIGIKQRCHGSAYEVSIMCGLWQRDKLITVLSADSDPWEVEIRQRNYGFDYYINSEGFPIDWGYRTFKHVGLKKGKWCREAVKFFAREGLSMNFSARGFYD